MKESIKQVILKSTKFERYYLATCFFIYIVFLLISLFNPGALIVTLLKVGSIFLCFLFVAIRNRKDWLLLLALFLTFAADVILAINNVEISGIIVFCLAQSLHFVRLSRNALKGMIIYTLVIIAILIVNFFYKTNFIYVVAGVYALFLITNLILAFNSLKRTDSLQAKCAFLGFVLFLICDLCVATSYLSLTGVFPSFLYNLANYCAWLFYLPAQVFLSNSSKTMVQ